MLFETSALKARFIEANSQSCEDQLRGFNSESLTSLLRPKGNSGVTF